MYSAKSWKVLVELVGGQYLHAIQFRVLNFLILTNFWLIKKFGYYQRGTPSSCQQNNLLTYCMAGITCIFGEKNSLRLIFQSNMELFSKKKVPILPRTESMNIPTNTRERVILELCCDEAKELSERKVQVLWQLQWVT